MSTWKSQATWEGGRVVKGHEQIKSCYWGARCSRLLSFLNANETYVLFLCKFTCSRKQIILCPTLTTRKKTRRHCSSHTDAYFVPPILLLPAHLASTLLNDTHARLNQSRSGAHNLDAALASFYVGQRPPREVGSEGTDFIQATSSSSSYAGDMLVIHYFT